MNLNNKSYRDLIREGIQNRAPGAGFAVRNATGPTATLRIYDVIGWPFIQAEDVAAELENVTADELEVQISSPGGDVFEAVAIFNALRAHPAKVTTRVDSIAASAASVIAQAGDERVMLSGSQMMIHEAWGLAIGPASEMRSYADVLDKQTGIIAGIYAERSGGDRDEFLQLMAEESWFDAEETVEAGLADRVVAPAALNNVPSKFAAQVDSLVGEIESFAEEAENVVAFRSQQGKPPLSDDVSEALTRAANVLSGLAGRPEPENEQVEEPVRVVDFERRRHEWNGRRHMEGVS